MELVVLDKYLIKTDNYTYMLATRSPKIKGNGFNLKEMSYYSTLDKVFNEIKERELRASDVTSLNELSQFLKDLSSRIDEGMKEVKNVFR